jgi:hypothetical protein
MTSTAFENRLTAELSSGGMFAVWCLRKRVYCLKRGKSADAHLGYGFDIAGIPNARHDFETVFDWLTRTAQQPIRLGCPKCGRMSRDEGLLLSAFAAFQRCERESGRILLRCLMPRVACLHAAPAAAKFADALQQADLPIDLADTPDQDTAQHNCSHPGAGCAPTVPSNATVH